jgi:hypothetical protein
MQGYEPICGESGTSGEKCLKQKGAVGNGYLGPQLAAEIGPCTGVSTRGLQSGGVSGQALQQFMEPLRPTQLSRRPCLLR